MQLRKRLLLISMAFCLMIAFLPILSGSFAFAEPTPQKLPDMNFDGHDRGYVVQYRWDVDDHSLFTEAPVSWGSTDESVAFVGYVDTFSATIIPCGTGECTIWFCDAENREAATMIGEVKITVNEAGLKRFLKEYHFLGENSGVYGTKKLKVEGPPGASYKIKIEKNTYTGTFAENGWATISLKKLYKYKTKITYSITSGGVTATFTEKIGNITDIAMFKALKGKKKIKIRVENVHKGDVVAVKYAGKTYKKKIKKNYHGKSTNVTIKLKKKLKKGKKVTVIVNNKYKQKLAKVTRKYHPRALYIYDREEEYD